MLVVSFYTPNYAEHAERLMVSLAAHNLPYWVESMSLGDHVPTQAVERWTWVCSRKAGFVRRALRSSSEPILWLDADAEVKRSIWYLSALMDGDTDFAVYHTPAARPKLQFRSGTALFNQTPAAHALVKRWEELCDEDPSRWDQESLYLAHKELGGVSTHWLDISYCQRIGKEPNGVKDPHILHHQASRQTKRNP